MLMLRLTEIKPHCARAPMLDCGSLARVLYASGAGMNRMPLRDQRLMEKALQITIRGEPSAR